MNLLPHKTLRGRHLACFSAALLLLLPAALGHNGAASAADPPIPAGAEFVPGEVVVTVEGDADPKTIAIPQEADPEAFAEQLEARPGIASASPNYVAHLSGWSPNDRGTVPGRPGAFGNWKKRQWNFLPCLSLCDPGAATSGPQSLGGMNVARGWQLLRRAHRSGAKGVTVAILDTGVAYRKLGKRYRRNPELSSRRFVPGYDFVDRDRIPLDEHGHGTHVASTVGQDTNNKIGLTGIAYRAKIMPVRVMDALGQGTAARIAKGIRWAASHDAQVISMSINFGCGTRVPVVEKALRFAYKRGVTLVGSAGNNGAQDCPSLPATAPQVISVGGSTESGCVANYSFRSKRIDLAAPGGGKPYADCPFIAKDRTIMQIGLVKGRPNRFGIEKYWAGTSMAAAHVAGAAAAVAASGVLGKKATPARITARLKQTARLPEYAAGKEHSGFGAGIVDLGKALDPAIPPG